MRRIDGGSKVQRLAAQPADPVVWRREQLVDAGFPRELAARLARDARYDLHVLVELVERGCPPALAARILTPLDEERLG